MRLQTRVYEVDYTISSTTRGTNTAGLTTVTGGDLESARQRARAEILRDHEDYAGYSDVIVTLGPIVLVGELG